LNGQIPASAVIPFAAALLTYLPAPTNTNLTNNYVILHPGTFDKDKGDAKIDWTPREGLSLFVRYSQARLNAFDPGTITGPAGGYGDGHVSAPAKQFVGGATWTINPKSVLEARFGFSVMQAGKTPPLAGQNTMTGNLALPGLPTDPQYLGGVTYQYFIAGNDFTSLGRLYTSPQYQNPTVWNPKVNYTRLMGKHSLKAGVEYDMIHVAQQDLHPVLGADAYANEWSGYAYYNGLYKGYSPYLGGSPSAENIRQFDFADFLLGYQAEIGLASPTISNIRSWGWAGYLQDDWKLSHKLTLNLGLRYEFSTPIYEANNKLANYDLATQSIAQASSSDPYTVDPNKTDFGPRLGAAYSLNQKTVVRGGFGIGYTHWNRVGSNYLTILSQRLHLHQHPERIPGQHGEPLKLQRLRGCTPVHAAQLAGHAGVELVLLSAAGSGTQLADRPCLRRQSRQERDHRERHQPGGQWRIGRAASARGQPELRHHRRDSALGKLGLRRSPSQG
jgi:hypothetical protein